MMKSTSLSIKPRPRTNHTRRVRFTLKSNQSRFVNPRLPIYDTPRFMSKRRKIKYNYN